MGLAQLDMLCLELVIVFIVLLMVFDLFVLLRYLCLAFLELVLCLNPLNLTLLEPILQRLVLVLKQLCKLVILPRLLLEAEFLLNLILQVLLDLFH